MAVVAGQGDGARAGVIRDSETDNTNSKTRALRPRVEWWMKCIFVQRRHSLVVVIVFVVILSFGANHLRCVHEVGGRKGRSGADVMAKEDNETS